MHGMFAHGFRIFHREANVLDVQRCWEYSFVRAVAPPNDSTHESDAKADLSREHAFAFGLTEAEPPADDNSKSLAIGAVPSNKDLGLLTEYLGSCLKGPSDRHSAIRSP
mmetsp:Transcript_27977/g.75821  ORF Transcript_27977/g.75821 Transcript_27977/m.75821 type:complete len:109 (+) Transcript_27977:174-500(+)